MMTNADYLMVSKTKGGKILLEYGVMNKRWSRKVFLTKDRALKLVAQLSYLLIESVKNAEPITLEGSDDTE